MTQSTAQKRSRLVALSSRIDPAVALVAAGCVVLVLGGAWVYPSFLSANYLLQQLQMASFLGIIATGATMPTRRNAAWCVSASSRAMITSFGAHAASATKHIN